MQVEIGVAVIGIQRVVQASAGCGVTRVANVMTGHSAVVDRDAPVIEDHTAVIIGVLQHREVDLWVEGSLGGAHDYGDCMRRESV